MARLNLIDYKISQRLFENDIPFSALIAAAMRKADRDNIEKLRETFPQIHDDLFKRYHARGGVLRDELEKVKDVNAYIEQAQTIADNYYSGGR